MKKLFKLFFLGGFSILMLCACNAGQSKARVDVDAEILQSLPDSVRQDALYRMISSVEKYNEQAFDFWEPLVRKSDYIIMGVALSLIFSLSVLIIIYMVLKARSRQLKSELEITEKLLERIERLQELNINIPDVKSLIPYTFNKGKTPYMFDATILGAGIALLVFATQYSEEFFGMLGILLTSIGALRCIVHIIAYFNNNNR